MDKFMPSVVILVLGSAFVGGFLIDYYKVSFPQVPEYLLPWVFVVPLAVAFTVAAFLVWYLFKDH